MPQEKIDRFRASLKRCLADDGFLNSFYEAFVGSSEEVREKFKNTDMKRQVRMLEDSLYVLAVAVQGGQGSPARGALSGIARKHSHAELDIRPGLYDLWLSALIQTAREVRLRLHRGYRRPPGGTPLPAASSTCARTTERAPPQKRKTPGAVRPRALLWFYGVVLGDGVTLAARGPLGLSTTSNVTLSPSLRVR